MIQELLLLAAAIPGPDFTPRVWGIELPVGDVEEAARMYGALGFGPGAFAGRDATVLANGELALVLRPTEASALPESAVSAYLNLRVADVEAARDRARAAGFLVRVGEPKRIPIGRALAYADAWGNRGNLIELDAEAGLDGHHGAGGNGIAVFNLGVKLPDYPVAEEFLGRLGLEVFSREYLPTALPYERAGAAGLVVHEGGETTPGEFARPALLFAVDDLSAALPRLTERELVAAGAAPRAGVVGRSVALAAPGGLALRVVERSSSQRTFERFRRLAGDWEGESTAGWESRAAVEVIARGTVVAHRTNFEAHPGETMMTMVHMDDGRLVLTHYCVAGNQPRLVATEFEEDGREVRFAFLDGTNLPSRNHGHMDEVVYRFADAGWGSTWSWYQDGKTSWMEEIRYRRAGGDG